MPSKAMIAKHQYPNPKEDKNKTNILLMPSKAMIAKPTYLKPNEDENKLILLPNARIAWQEN